MLAMESQVTVRTNAGHVGLAKVKNNGDGLETKSRATFVSKTFNMETANSLRLLGSSKMLRDDGILISSREDKGETTPPHLALLIYLHPGLYK